MNKNTKEILIIVVVLIIAGFTYFKFFSDKSKLITIKEDTRNLFNDPESVNFKNIEKHLVNEKPYYCGQVNAKNLFGAYIGYKKFMGFIHRGETVIYLENDNKLISKSLLIDPYLDNDESLKLIFEGNAKTYKILWKERCN